MQLAALEVDLDLDPRNEKVVMNEITDPGVDIHHEAALIHGITPEMVKGKRQDHLASKDLYDYIQSLNGNVILCTHNGTTFDLPILNRLAGEGDPYARPPLQVPHIDTLVCATRLWPKAPNHKLSLPTPEEQAKHGGPGLVQQLKLGTGEGAHDALADIRMVTSIVFYVLNNLKLPEQKSSQFLEPMELARWCATPRILQIAHFGKHKGMPWGKGPGCVPAGYVRFITENWDDASPDMRATIKHHYGRDFVKMRGKLL